METYWITGVQLGIIKAFLKGESSKGVGELIDKIIEEQQTFNEVRKQ